MKSRGDTSTIRAWLGLALLSGSWLLGLGYYMPAHPLAWVAAVAAGVLLLIGVERLGAAAVSDAPDQRQRGMLPIGCTQAAIALVLMLPAVWFAPWPYRAGPLLMVIGLALRLLPVGQVSNLSRTVGQVSNLSSSANHVSNLTQPVAGNSRVPWLESLSLAAIAAGAILLAQAIVLAAYSAHTARDHDLPPPVAQLLAEMMNLLGVDASADGPTVVMHALRKDHRLAVTWDLAVDPVSVCFFFGGLTMLAVAAWSNVSTRRRWMAWPCAGRNLALVEVAWLPLRLGLVTALYLHRAVRSDYDLPLHVMDHFFSPWLHLLLTIPPMLLAWRFARMPIAELSGQPSNADVPPAQDRGRDARATIAAAGLVVLAAALITAAAAWQPVGPRQQGRVMVVERHSKWEPTNHPYDTTRFGGDDENSSGYTYSAMYDYLGQFYGMSRLEETGKIDDRALAACDVLVIKTPTARYEPEEVQAVVRFVQGGGGLLLIGDHTNFDRSSSSANDITRYFGFTFRDDLLFSFLPRPDQQRYLAAGVPHPAVQHVPWFDFAVSCSIDPGAGRGQPVIESMGLWNMPPDFHYENFMPHAQHCPEMRYGPFIQAWSARHGEGRVLAFADSTIFSSFCIYQPNKAELMLNMIEWLNHANSKFDPSGLLIVLGAGSLAAGGWLARGRRGAWLVLAAAGACGWAAGSEAVVALQRRAMPLPEAVRPMPRVVIDRTTSQVPLAEGAYNEDKEGRGYGLLEQWIPRIGCYTVRAENQAAFSGEMLVVICPTLPASQDFRDRLTQFVADGGKLLVIDAFENGPSTADSLLRPFGLSFDRMQNWQGKLALAGDWPWIDVQHAWEVKGGQPVASLGHERTVCAAARYGKGRVMALGFGGLFNDASMGGTWQHSPDEKELIRYQVLFALLRSLVEDRPVAAPPTLPQPPGPTE